MPQGPSSPGGTADAIDAPTSVPRLILRAGVSLAVVAVAFATIAIGLGGEDVRFAFEAITVRTLLLVVGLSILNYVARVVRWLLLFRAVDRRGPGRALADAPLQALVYIGGFAFTLTPGRAGEVIRAWMVKKSFGTPAHAGVSLVVADRFYDAVGLTLILAVVTTALARDLTAPLVMALVLGASIAFLAWTSSAPRFWSGLAARAPFLSKPVGAIARTLGHLAVVSHPRRLPLFALPSVVGWSVQSLAPLLILSDLGVSLSPMQAIFIAAFATLVGGITFLPGGLGGFEVTMVALLTAMDVPVATAIVATLAMRLTALWFSVLLGVAALTAWLALQGRRRE